MPGNEPRSPPRAASALRHSDTAPALNVIPSMSSAACIRVATDALGELWKGVGSEQAFSMEQEVLIQPSALAAE